MLYAAGVRQLIERRTDPNDPCPRSTNSAVSKRRQGAQPAAMTNAVVRALPATTAHLRQVMGDQRFEALAARGATLEPADLVRYVREQIELAPALV
jgi:hypothetical protein